MSYEDGVYDITEFIKRHPGGSEKILMAAGGPLEPFWEMYPFHKVETIIEMLRPYKIGILHAEDRFDKSKMFDFKEIQ